MQDVKVDLLVIGGGSGGVRAARVAAGHGARVVLVEEHRLGGTCVIRGCVPKKLMVLASRFRTEFDDAAGFGWDMGAPRFDWRKLKSAVDQEVDRLEKLYAGLLESAGVEVLHDRAVFDDAHTVRLMSSGRTIRADHVLIATGAVPDGTHDIPGGQWIANSNQLFEWGAQPARVVVQGAGYIGLEFASVLRLLGSEVTVVMRGTRVLRGFDDEVRSHLQAALIESGIRIVEQTQLTRIDRCEQSGTLSVRLSNGTQLEADAVLGATGRVPNTANLRLDRAGVQLDRRGAVVVTDLACTTSPGIYAVGDVANVVALTPVAIREGHALADRLFGGKEPLCPPLVTPTAVFTTPEVGITGLSEEAAIAAFPDEIDVFVSRFRPMKARLSARTGQVLMKLIVHRPTDRLLGVHMVGPEAAEMIQLLSVAVQAGLRKSDVDTTLAVHPTAAEEFTMMREPVRRYPPH
ncbi:glutathione-disulfide reductase (plasmid) [Paraburkholderia sp. D15]|uniref:glutathione-disulfide reductase n=1 Tax=Paraburkholderia sp. D15 TaxID=2880218 RepID=UPI0024786444|nr:glutathione-disulfide reductase [Paraburkholderia sp. D15]WGS55154.1 glutathione-disulfide reductase [Paraburkholderia sp. D15]